MFRCAGIEVDEACKDLSRLFRLPNVTRDGEYVEPMILDTTAHTVEVASFPKEVRNYRIEEDMESGKKFKVPIGGKALRSQIFEATGGWPRLVSGQLFYLQDEEVVYLDDSNAFLMWLEEEVDYLHIFEGSGFLTKTEIFTSIKMWNPESYDTIHKYPYEPLYDKTYLLNEIEPTVGTEKLDGLLDFFYPDSEVDRLVMKAAFCTPMFNSKDRPVFTVDSSSGRGAGKTSLVEVIGSLYGGLIEIPVNKVKVELKDEAKRAFFYEGGRSKRVVLVDNVQGFFGNSGFASIVTCKEISARRPYAKSTESRKNDVTWFITSNDANYDKDYISRTVFLFLKNHPPVDNFNKKVYEYLDKHKETILGEIINLIQADSDITLPTFTRFVDWEQKVLKKVCKGDDDYSKIMKSLTDNKEHFDSDLEVCDSIVNQINGAIKNTTGGYFLPKKDLHKLYKEGGGEMGYYTFKSVVSEAIKTGGLGRLKAVEKNGGRHARNGKYCWLWESSDGSAPLLTAYTLGKFTPVS
jgi:hypothetical protein